jgi:capsule polysaccharide export protein KpsE/RkpR
MESSLPSYTLKDLQDLKELSQKLLDYHEANLKRCPEKEAELRFSLERAVHYAKADIAAIDAELDTRKKNERQEETPKATTPSNTHADES